jgi:hypothetical protein
MTRYGVGEITMPLHGDKDLDEHVFGDAVIELSKSAPVTVNTDVLSDCAFLVNRSVGSFGNFRDWFDRGFRAALISSRGVLTRELFEECALSNKRSKKFHEEASGEERNT